MEMLPAPGPDLSGQLVLSEPARPHPTPLSWVLAWLRPGSPPAPKGAMSVCPVVTLDDLGH